MEKITEEQMGLEFEKILNRYNHTKDIPAFDSVFREVPSVQGIPDYIGIRFINGSVYKRQIPKIEESYLSSVSSILALIKKNSPRTEEYIISKTGLSSTTVRRSLNYLNNIGIICPVDKKRKYVLSPTIMFPNVEIWAFELKLNDWKRAIFQALRYNAFANYVYIVLPVEKKNIIINNKELFKNLNIGVILFNILNGEYEIIIKSKKTFSNSKANSLYMQGQLLNKYKNNERIKFFRSTE